MDDPKCSRPHLTPELMRVFAQLLRDRFQLEADVASLASILEGAVLMDQPPFGWLEALKQMRETVEYRNTSEQYAQQLAQVEKIADAVEWENFLKSIPPTHFLN